MLTMESKITCLSDVGSVYRPSRRQQGRLTGGVVDKVLKESLALLFGLLLLLTPLGKRVIENGHGEAVNNLPVLP
jgi:hypothetical protein